MLNVVIVGAGQGGTNILKTLLSVSEVNILGVCDSDLSAPGIKLAREKGLTVFSRLEEALADKNEKLVFEVTGSKQVREKIIALQNDNTRVIDSSAALLISKIVNSREKMITRLANESGKLSRLAGDLGHSIAEITTANQNNMDNLNQTVNQLLTASNKSQTNIEETNQMVKFIRDVSEQTKMLGLNAAIEAARADSHGHGFSVVATEIRKLADETGNSVKRITHFTEELNQAIISTLQNIDQMHEQVDRVTENQNQISQTLAQIAAQINEMSDNLNKLSHS